MNPHKDAAPNNRDLISKGWEDYQLLDSGNRSKLERFGSIELVRFEPQAVWKPALSEERWQQAYAVYSMDESRSSGSWTINRPIPPEWVISYHTICFCLSVHSSRHIGIFPEQLPNWDWLAKTVAEVNQPLSILNLFAHTGGMTAFACLHGAKVTHVDASKSALQRAQRNLALSSLQDRSVRWILDDAYQFVQREVRRGNQYDGIIMDPPAFGRGPKKQIWKFEQSLPPLLDLCTQLLVRRPSLFLLTAYNVNEDADEIYRTVSSIFPASMAAGFQWGNLVQQEESAGRRIQQAIYIRWPEQKKGK